LADSGFRASPITGRVWAEEGAKILEQGEIIPGHLASASLIAARVTGADPKVLAAVIRGAVMNTLRPTLSRSQCAGPDTQWKGRRRQPKDRRPPQSNPHRRSAACEGDHHSTLTNPHSPGSNPLLSRTVARPMIRK